MQPCRPIFLIVLILVLAVPVWAGPKNQNGDNAETAVSARCVNAAGTGYVGCGDEEGFSYQTPVATDTVVKASAGYVKHMMCSATDNAAVAGTIQLRDATSAGTGAIVLEWTVLAIDYTQPGPLIFPVHAVFATGIVIDFTTTSDVKCWLTYR